MPYIGARTRHYNKVVQIKVFGPDKNFSFKKDELATYLRNIMQLTTEPPCLSDYVGNKITKVLRNDHNALWVEVEIHETDDHSFDGNTYMIKEEVSV